MRKIIGILLIGLITGCSVFKNSRKTVTEVQGNVVTGNVLEDAESQNITNTGFFIQKAEIETITSEGKDKFIANIKFEKPDKYLISIRSRTGIEGARIYISGDSIQMNDRINKKLYYGTSIYLEKKYGFSQSFLPLLFGDLILEKRCKTDKERCLDYKITVDCQLKGIPISYEIDCRKEKVITVDQVRSINKEGISIKFDKYFKSGTILIPRIVEFNDNKSGLIVKIKVLKVQSPWTGNINFVPGKGYELIELL